MKTLKLKKAAATAATYALLTILSITSLYPFFFMMMNSVREKYDYILSPLGFPKTFTLENIFRVIDKDNFVVYLANSILLTALSTAIAIILSCISSFAFAKMKFKGRRFIFNFVITLMSIPPVVVVIPLFVMMVNLKMINSHISVILIYIAFIVPFSVLFITNFFRAIPQEMLEAAYIDGCRNMRILFSILMPVSMAPIITMFVVNALWVWNDLLIALLFLQTESKRTLMVAVSSYQSRMTYNPTMIFASLTIASIPIVAVYLFSQKYFIKGLTSGYMK